MRVFSPWPLKAIVDRLVAAHTDGNSGNIWRAGGGTIIGIAALGLLAQLAHQLVMLWHTRLQTRVGQRIIFDTVDEGDRRFVTGIRLGQDGY